MSWVTVTLDVVTLRGHNMCYIRHGDITVTCYTWLLGYRRDVTVAADILLPSVNGSQGAGVAVRVDRGGCGVFAAKGVYFWLSATAQKFLVTGDLGELAFYNGK